jgi:hypothetical protein
VRVRLAGTALALAVAFLPAGCGGTARSGSGTAYSLAGQTVPGGTARLVTSLTTAAGTWAVAVMGGSAASHNNSWQLFERPSGSSRWKLVTPPGVADNGGLVLAGAGGPSLITALRPSQNLTFTPLAVTRDGGTSWAQAGPLGAALADSPDALAASPGTGRLLALLRTGAAETAVPGYARWATLVTTRTLAKAPAGSRCGLRELTAAAFTATGEPMLAGSCSRPGIAGVFAFRDGGWQPAGLDLPASLARQQVAVVRLTRTRAGMTALLEAGAGPEASLVAAWSTGRDGGWVLSRPVRLRYSRLTSTSFGTAGAAAIILNGRRAEAIAGPAGTWRPLPSLPGGTATVVANPAGGYSAVAVSRAKLTIWQLWNGSNAWHAAQSIKVPIQDGSSG